MQNNYYFLQHLTSNIDADEAFVSKLLQNCNRKHFEKGTIIVKAGDFCHNTFFVEKGLLRQYSLDERGKEHNLNFAPEGWYMSDRNSMYFDLPSDFFIEALEPTDVFVLTKELVAVLDKELPGFTEFNGNLLHSHIRALQNRINLLLSATAEERYLSFIKMYPDILFRVPQWMIASYLGITPESLSRVRKNLAKGYQ